MTTKSQESLVQPVLVRLPKKFATLDGLFASVCLISLANLWLLYAWVESILPPNVLWFGSWAGRFFDMTLVRMTISSALLYGVLVVVRQSSLNWARIICLAVVLAVWFDAIVGYRLLLSAGWQG